MASISTAPPATSPSSWLELSDALKSGLSNTLQATIPIWNIVRMIAWISKAYRCKQYELLAPSNPAHAPKRAYYRGMCETNAMRAVATFMVAAGSALLLVGLYYYTAADYALSNDLLMIGGIVTGAGPLLFLSASYWNEKTSALLPSNL